MAISMMPQMMNFVNNLEYVVIYIAWLMLIIEGSIKYEMIVVFIIYIKRFNQPVTEITDIIAMMQSVASASKRVFEVLPADEMGSSPPTYEIWRFDNHVKFRDVRFGYTPEREIIHGFSLDVRPESKMTIVGPMGTGKTTLANLLVRFYDPDSGRS